MEEEQKTKNSILFGNISRSDLAAFAALFISFAALLVSIMEANIMREQQQIMVTQQKASVYPYLEVQSKYSLQDECVIEYYLENKGIGPARIRTAELFLNGELIETASMIKMLSDIFDRSVKMSLVVGDATGTFLSAEDSYTLLKLDLKNVDANEFLLSKFALTSEICYCSIYDDCWYLSQEGGEPTQNCQIINE